MATDRRELMEIELERLQGEGDALAREWQRVPYLGFSIVLLGPVFWIWGPTATLYAFLCVPSLVATAAYLIGVRRRENRELIHELERQLGAGDPG